MIITVYKNRLTGAEGRNRQLPRYTLRHFRRQSINPQQLPHRIHRILPHVTNLSLMLSRFRNVWFRQRMYGKTRRNLTLTFIILIRITRILTLIIRLTQIHWRVLGVDKDASRRQRFSPPYVIIYVII